jgi:streptogramin lyase
VTDYYPYGYQIGYPTNPYYPFAVAPDGTAWFASVDQTSSSTNVFPAIAHASGQQLPAMYALPGTIQAYSATYGPDGNIWVGTTTNQVLKYSASGGLLASYTMKGSTLSQAEQMAVGPDGNMWVVVYSSAHALQKINVSTGAVTPIASKLAPVLAVPNPDGNTMATGPDNAFWYTAGGTQLQRLTATGAYSTYSFTTSDGNGGVNNVARGSDGNIWFTGGYYGFGVFHMHTIAAKPAAVTISPGASTSITIAERGYSGSFTAGGNCNYLSPATGTTFTVSPPANAPAYKCIASFVDANNMATVYVPITTK